MATFDLTPARNVFNGTATADLFSGFGGGNDALRGNGGNDTFDIQYSQEGLIDGGAGTDRLLMQGHNNNTLSLDLRVQNVENLFIYNTNLYATADQLNSFGKITPVSASNQFSIFLQGEGGVLDLTTRYVSTKALSVEATMVTSSVTITGSARGDDVTGSDFNDRISGGGGNDDIFAGLGHDVVNGGLGRDFLSGDDGRDTFVFNVEPISANYDRITDFVSADDTIRLENGIFTGLPTGWLQANRFKDIGVAGPDADDRVLYNSTNGALYFDEDGAGGNARVLVAVLEADFVGNVPVLSAADFFVV